MCSGCPSHNVNNGLNSAWLLLSVLKMEWVSERHQVTVRRRANNRVSESGPPTDNEEEQLATYCVQMADMGFGLLWPDVMFMAFKIAESTGRNHLNLEIIITFLCK